MASSPEFELELEEHQLDARRDSNVNFGLEMRGQRLLPNVVDYYAKSCPERVYAAVPKSNNVEDGFEDVTMAEIASAVNVTAWWMCENLPSRRKPTISYVGPSDLRYVIIFLAALKCDKRVLFISPRNTLGQNLSMLSRSECAALIHAEEMRPMAIDLASNASQFTTHEFLSKKALFEAKSEVYPWLREYEKIKDEKCLILHSSGSTGEPKLVYMTHGTISVTDNDYSMPVPAGRRAQNGDQFNFKDGGRFYSCFPPYHLAGVQAYIIQPILSLTATVVLGPSQMPPSGYLLADIMKHQCLRAFYVPPFVIEQWISVPGSLDRAKDLDFVLYGGGPLSPSVGNALEKVTNVCQMYGALETGQIQMLVPQLGEWEYLEPNPYEECDMQHVDDGLYEMVLHQHPKFLSRRSLAHNYPDMETWRTRDLFTKHPTKPGLWRFHSRIDDAIVLSSGHKVRPLEMETIIQGHPLVSGALVVGNGKPEPLLIIEPTRPIADAEYDSTLEEIWPLVVEANATAPTYSHINRSRIIFARLEAPFIRAPKGTVIRRLTFDLYKTEIENAYTSQGICMSDSLGEYGNVLLEGTKQFLRTKLLEICPDTNFQDNDNFMLGGIDSLKAAELGRKLILSSSEPPLRQIYLNPTINDLAKAVILPLLNPKPTQSEDISNFTRMEDALQNFTKGLPTPHGQLPSEGINVVLIGPRGTLGPHILRSLANNPHVGSITCLNRGENGRNRMAQAFTERRLGDLDNLKPRLEFYSFAIGEPNLGLSSEKYAHLLKETHLVIHNAWKIGFVQPMESFTPFIHSIRETIDFSAHSVHGARVVFISSIASVQEWASVYDTRVSEAPLQSWKVASPLGYGQSKHVCERILTVAAEESRVPVAVLRVGQVAGPAVPTAGIWNTDEWIPSLARLSMCIRVVPNDLSDIDWVPVDTMGKIIEEIATADKLHAKHEVPLKIFNLVNPQLRPFARFIEALETQEVPLKRVPMRKWVETLAAADLSSIRAADRDAITKILPFFRHLAEKMAQGAALQPKFETKNGEWLSQSLRSLEGIESRLINSWCHDWQMLDGQQWCVTYGAS